MTRDDALTVLRRLTDAGYEAYFAGGCVRDTLLRRPVHDWDITTSARPETVRALFPRTVPTGLRHGTVTVLIGRAGCEVTTFRADLGYADHRRPDRVAFLPDLASDLARRDFTVNAMAMDAAGAVTDRHGGRDDLRARLIRCVGDPVRRFTEDALRMLRAIRFSAQLGFAVEEETARAVAACAPLCRTLSAERVRDELEKTLLSPRPDYAAALLRLALPGLIQSEEASLAGPGQASCERTARWAALKQSDCERTARWAALKRALPALDLAALRLDRRTRTLVETAAAVDAAALDEAALKRLVAVEGRDAARCACASAGRAAWFETAAAAGGLLTLRELAVTGRDLGWLDGPAVGRMLRRLLDYALAHPEQNRKPRLLSLARMWSEGEQSL